MSQQTAGIRFSYDAGESITAYRVVALNTAGSAVVMWDTSSTQLLGVSADFADSGGACQIIIGGTAKLQCVLSVSAGAIVGPSTDSNGQIVERSNNTTTSYAKNIGIALTAGSTNSVIEVLLMPSNRPASA